MKKVVSLAATICLLSVSSGCNTTAIKEQFNGVVDSISLPGKKTSGETAGAKQRGGTLLGGVIGFAAGEKFCGGNFQSLCKIGSTALGAYVGNKVGKKLDDADKQKMAESTKQAFVTGTTSSWSNPENKTSGTVKVVETKTKNKPVQLPVLKDKIKQVPPLEIIGESYTANGRTKVRGGPGTDYVELVDQKLNQGQVVNVVGQVKGNNWFMISQNGVGSGFVRMDLLTATPDAEVPFDSDAIDQSQLTNVDIAPQRVCRMIEQSVTLADGSTEQATLEACQGPNGWEVV